MSSASAPIARARAATRGRLLAVSVVGLCLLGGVSVCEAGEPSAPPGSGDVGPEASHRVVFGNSIYAGGWHFHQVGPAARDIGGVSLGVTLSAALTFASGIVLGLETGATVYLPADGRLKPPNPDRSFSSTAAPGYELGILAGWRIPSDRPLIELQLVTGVLYAGNHSEWSGAGPFVSPGFTLFFLHAARMHLGIEVKGQFATLPLGVPSNDQKVLYGGSLGLIWSRG